MGGGRQCPAVRITLMALWLRCLSSAGSRSPAFALLRPKQKAERGLKPRLRLDRAGDTAGTTRPAPQVRPLPLGSGTGELPPDESLCLWGKNTRFLHRAETPSFSSTTWGLF